MQGQCNFCKLENSFLKEIKYVKKFSLVIKKYICPECIETKNFFFLDKDNIVRYNEVTSVNIDTVFKILN